LQKKTAQGVPDLGVSPKSCSGKKKVKGEGKTTRKESGHCAEGGCEGGIRTLTASLSRARKTKAIRFFWSNCEKKTDKKGAAMSRSERGLRSWKN